MMIYSPIQLDMAALAEYSLLFSACFPKSSYFTTEYLDWLYCQNPDGPAVGFDAWNGKSLAAHYVCVPIHVSVAGKNAKAMLSLNTATHPIYRGSGLFTKLAEMTFDLGHKLGFEYVIGVGNANSTPGFIRKLGFRLIQPLEARIGVGNLGIDWDAVNRNVQFMRRWTEESLAWRCANPRNPIHCRIANDRIHLYAAAKGKVLPVFAELWHDNVPSVKNNTESTVSPLRLFIGLIPDGACRFRNYLSIPQKFRPSPLNLILRSLSDPMTTIEQGSVSMSFIDFDAY